MSKGIKSLCKEAKKRLSDGYWTNYLESRESDVLRAKRSGVSEDYVLTTYRAKVSNELMRRDLPLPNEDELLDKVRSILSSEEIVMNPISRIMDREYYEGLDAQSAQRYVLRLSEAYVTLKKKVEEEMRYKVTMDEAGR